jgi:anti-anti-sigma regulatory factor
MLEVDRRSWVTVARLVEAELWSDTVVDALGRELAELAASSDQRPLVLSCAAVQLFASSLVAKLLWLSRRLQAQGACLVLCELPANLAAMLLRLRVSTLLTIYAAEQEALWALDA